MPQQASLQPLAVLVSCQDITGFGFGVAFDDCSIAARGPTAQGTPNMSETSRRNVVRGFVAGGILGAVGTRPVAAAEPVTLRLGYGGAAEEQVWLLIAKPELGKNHGKLYKLDATRFQSSDKRAQAFEAGAIDLTEGSATGVIFAAAEGVASKIICSITKESKRGFSTAFYVPDESPIKSVP